MYLYNQDIKLVGFSINFVNFIVVIAFVHKNRRKTGIGKTMFSKYNSQENARKYSKKQLHGKNWMKQEAWEAAMIDFNLPKALYNCGTYVKRYGSENSTDCVMQSVTSTTIEEVMEYVDVLKASGYQEESHSSIENNYFYRLIQDDKRVYVNYYANEEKAIVVLDEQKGVSTAEISYTYEPKAGEHTEVYMFGLKMDPNGMNISAPENTSGYVNNGECLIIKCADNSVIIVDGGDTSQMGDTDRERFTKLLDAITGKKEDEVITISAWCVTHIHNDHVMGFKTVLDANPEKYKVERVICNMPNPDVTNRGRNVMFVNTANAILENAPSCQDIKVHTGDVIRIADVTLTILYTHEDLADQDGVFPTRDFNATSTVFMVETNDGMRLLVTGDITERAEAVLCKHFTGETLKCDILQQPHHNFNDNTIVYEYADAQVMLMIQSLGGLTKNEMMIKHSDTAKKWCSEWYCGGNETAGFAYENGKAKRIYHATDIYD